MREPMRPHLQSLVGANAQIRARLGAAEQHKACLLVLSEIGIRRRLIDLAFHQLPGTGKAAPLKTDGREPHALACSRIPHELIFAADQTPYAFGRLQDDLRKLCPGSC